MSLQLSGLYYDLENSLEELRKACLRSDIKSLELSDFEIEVSVAADCVNFLRKHASILKDVSFRECCGHIDIVITLCLTSLARLESLKISTSAFGKCAHSIGVGLLTNSTLKRLELNSGSKAFFTLSTEAARSLEQGLSGSCLEKFYLAYCRFETLAAIRLMANGLKNNKMLKEVCLKNLFAANGQVLADDEFPSLLRALEQNPDLVALNISGNKCLRRGVAALSTLLDHTKLERLNMSCQVIDQSEFLDLSLLVAALGRTRSLESIELRYNKIEDRDVPYLAAVLSHNTSIRHLGLEGNRITDTGVSILASRIPAMKGLESLILRNNPLGQNAALELAEALKPNLSIQRIDFDSSVANHDKVAYYADLNWGGRRFLIGKKGGKFFNRALWPLVFERVNQLIQTKNGRQRYVDTLYVLLKDGTALFPM